MAAMLTGMGMRHSSAARKLVYVSICTMLAACSEPECGNQVKSETESPDKRLVATHFERNCGATTQFVQVVSIRPIGSLFDGNNTDEFVFTMQGNHEIDLHWMNASQLVIGRPSIRVDIFKERESWRDISIQFVPL